MHFTVLKRKIELPFEAKSCAYLVTDHWNDHFTFSTLYTLTIFDALGTKHNVGHVKIGEIGLEDGRPSIPTEFQALEKTFFSLGQDDSYYENLNNIGSEFRDQVLHSLRDCALDQELFKMARQEPVMKVSLLRFVSERTVTDQFSRMAKGGARLTSYEFTYETRRSATLSFKVRPSSNPPTNIHVLIGRNGVGKTTILHCMTKEFLRGEKEETVERGFSFRSERVGEEQRFSRLVLVAFSAFDSFESPSNAHTDLQDRRFIFLGLNSYERKNDLISQRPRSLEEIAEGFAESVIACRVGARFKRWRRALETLEADPIFSDMEVSALGACAVGCFGWAGWRSAGNETSGFLLRSATRGHRPAGGRRMPVDGPAGRADWGRISWFHAAASPGIRLMFSARHTRAHSPRAWSRPRTLKRRKPSACLIQPLGASDSHLRLA